MPRLVLCPTAVPRRLDRAPDALAHRQGRSRPMRERRRRRSPRSRRRSCCGPSARRCTLPGFSASSSARQASRKARATSSACDGRAQAPSWPWRRAGRPAPRRETPRPDGRRCGCRLTRCNPFHAGIEFTSSTKKPPVTGLDDVDPGIIGADASRRTHREIDKLLAGDRRLGAGALLDIGDPARAVPDHGGDDAALAHEDPPVLMMRLRRRDELLEIIGAVHLLRRGEIGERARSGASLCLAPRTAASARACGLRASTRCSDLPPPAARPTPVAGARRRDARALQEEGGGRFVDAALDGAGIVPHRDAKLAQAHAARRDRA